MKIKQNIIFAILGAGILLFIYSLYQRPPHLDDAWIGEQVYWLNESGIVKNVLMKNYANNQDGLLTFHKALVYSGHLAVKSFGFHLNVLRSITLLYLLGFFCIFYFYMVKMKRILNIKQYAILLALLIMEPHLFEYSFVFRPEVMLMTTGFLSYIFLERIIDEKKQNILNIILVSFFTGFGMLLHLNGLVFVIAAGILLLFSRKNKALLLFVIINFGFIVLYFYHLGSIENITLWFTQLTSYETGKSNIGFSWDFAINTLLKLLDEQRRFFHSPAEIIPSILFFISLIIGFKTIKRSNPFILTYYLILILSLALLAPSKTSKYLIPLFPYMVIIIVLTIKEFWKFSENKSVIIPKTWKSILLLICITLFIVVSTIFNIKISSKKLTPSYHHDFTQEFVKTNTKETTLLAPMVFIYDEIDNFKEIIGLMSFNERSKTDDRLEGGGFLKVANEEGIDYIFINDHYINKFKLQEQIETVDTEYYKVVGRKDGLTILEAKQK